MISKIIGAAAGAKVAKQASGIGGATGAAIGAAAPFILKRLSIPGMIALGVGGYVAKRVMDKRRKKAELSSKTQEHEMKAVKSKTDSTDSLPASMPTTTNLNGKAAPVSEAPATA